MKLFSKKKQKQEVSQKSYDFTKWESDFGFLLLMINRRVQLIKKFEIEPFAAEMLEKNDFIRDKDINEMYLTAVNDIYTSISTNYINFLVDKYFSNEKALIAFISETVMEDLIEISVSINNDKIKTNYSAEMTKVISEMNQGKKEK